MNAFASVILAVQMLSALGMIGLILIQHGKGADMGASFGSGSSGSLFGASGSANFLSRSTAGLATVFFVATLALAYLSNARPVSSGDRKSTRLNSSHSQISYAVFCLKKKKNNTNTQPSWH